MQCCFVLLLHDTRAIAGLTVRKSSALQNHYSTIPQCNTLRLNCSKKHCVLHMTVLHFCMFTAGGSFGLLPIVPISILFGRIWEDGDDNAAHGDHDVDDDGNADDKDDNDIGGSVNYCQKVSLLSSKRNFWGSFIFGTQR